MYVYFRALEALNSCVCVCCVTCQKSIFKQQMKKNRKHLNESTSGCCRCSSGCRCTHTRSVLSKTTTLGDNKTKENKEKMRKTHTHKHSHTLKSSPWFGASAKQCKCRYWRRLLNNCFGWGKLEGKSKLRMWQSFKVQCSVETKSRNCTLRDARRL